MGLTSIGKLFFSARQKALERHFGEGLALQEAVLKYLLEQGKLTEFGRRFGFENIKNYEDFARLVPKNDYESLKADIDRMRRGESDILWPGRTKWFAKSSGTTNDKSKFIPVTVEGLKNLHYRGGKDVMAFYLQNHPESRIFDGKGLILGGSHQPNYSVSGSLVGDLSAILIENINPLANLVRTQKKSTALLADFEEKRDRIARETMHQNVTNL
ncbi:MAG: GH3 auxin-responsive promoter family protein, partial [Prevotella sp.]|nr:GH3 auxin-responsive promoter family protein [Prevotella sp.]